MAPVIILPPRCGHCYRPSTSTIYRRPAWRVLLGRPPEVRIVCDEHRESYRRPSRWSR